MEAVATGQRGDGNNCGAASTEPTTGPKKLKRSAKFALLFRHPFSPAQ